MLIKCVLYKKLPVIIKGSIRELLIVNGIYYHKFPISYIGLNTVICEFN